MSMREPLDTEDLLLRFREWLTEASAEVPVDAPAGVGSGAPESEVGLYRLVEEFTALRQELKLQTKSTRGLQEQTETLLPALRQAIEQLRAAASAPAPTGGASRAGDSAWKACKPLAEALADLDEALKRGRGEIEKARSRLVDEPDRALAEALDAHLARQSRLRRWWFRGYDAQVRAVVAAHGAEKRQRFFEALLEGYDLIRSRLRRALEAAEIKRIECLGRPVDPERMIVLEVVEDPTRPPGEVIEEVRSGYTWGERVLRYAEVRASREPLPRWDVADAPAAAAEESDSSGA
jgi:molecular chaperone GrpE